MDNITLDMSHIPNIITNKGLMTPVRFLGHGSYGAVFLYKLLYETHQKDIYYVCKYLFLTGVGKDVEYQNMKQIYSLIGGCQPYIVCYSDQIIIKPGDLNYNKMINVLQKIKTNIKMNSFDPIIGYISKYIDGPVLTFYRFVSENDCGIFLKQMFYSLYILHSKNIIHSDIKLENIIYDMTTKYFVIIDFGTASICENFSYQCINNPIRGTYVYMPNKLLNLYRNRRISTLNERKFQDIYGVMLSLYRRLNNKFPYNHIMIDNKYFNDERNYTPSNSIYDHIDIVLNYFFETYLNNDYTYTANLFRADTSIQLFNNLLNLRYR